MQPTPPPQTTTGSLIDSPATPEQERPRRRQPSAARSSRSGMRDQSLTQFAQMDDENVSQQVSTAFCIFSLDYIFRKFWYVFKKVL